MSSLTWLGISQPVVQAGMSRRYTSPELVAAVSAAGGLGTLGCLDRPADQVVADIRQIRSLTDRPFALNFVVHRLDEAAFAAGLAERVPVVTFFRGQPSLVVARAKAAGATVLYQITTPAEAQVALAAGADGLIAQGHEAGGHNGPIPLWSLLPAVIAVAAGRPVLAAGGIIDGTGLAAARCLGAAGVVMGTRFLATPEAPIPATTKAALLAAGPQGTVATTLYDQLWELDWPGVTARLIRNRFTERWLGREAELVAQRATVAAHVRQAEAAGDTDEMPLLAGAGVSRLDALRPAGQIVTDTVATARQLLQAALSDLPPVS